MAMDEKDKKIASLEKDVAELKKHATRMQRVIAALEKKLTRVYHDHHNTSIRVNAIASKLTRSTK
jgi:prefoldin subunit 5